MPIDYNQIDEGVRDLVRKLREEYRFETTDSGDGSNYEAGMECAIPDRHVFMKVAPAKCLNYAWQIHEDFKSEYPDLVVEVTYRVGDLAFILFYPDGIAMEKQ